MLKFLPKLCLSFADCQNWTSLELLQHVRLTWIGKNSAGKIGMDLFKCCKVWKFYLNGFWVTVAESKLDLVSTWHNYGAKT